MGEARDDITLGGIDLSSVSNDRLAQVAGGIEIYAIVPISSDDEILGIKQARLSEEVAHEWADRLSDSRSGPSFDVIPIQLILTNDLPEKVQVREMSCKVVLSYPRQIDNQFERDRTTEKYVDTPSPYSLEYKYSVHRTLTTGQKCVEVFIRGTDSDKVEQEYTRRVEKAKEDLKAWAASQS